MVRLLLEVNSPFLQNPLRFNPTMVRLLPGLTTSGRRALNSFQSHNGAIAATDLLCLRFFLLSFQSHNGAIAAPADCGRVEREREFQSHNGAIAATKHPTTQ